LGEEKVEWGGGWQRKIEGVNMIKLCYMHIKMSQWNTQLCTIYIHKNWLKKNTAIIPEASWVTATIFIDI
jgi:hypothetical protein